MAHRPTGVRFVRPPMAGAGMISARRFRHLQRLAVAGLVLILGLSACSVTDTRRASDSQSCVAMGHVPGSDAFRFCLNELNARRCEAAAFKGRRVLVETQACTRLRESYDE
jgi:hypothetical protein